MSKPTAIISPLQHRGATHIKVVIENKAHPKKLINQIEGRRWSATHRCWYVPKTEEIFQQLKELFEVKISKGMAIKHVIQPETSTPNLKKQSVPKSNVVESVIVEKEHDYRVKVFIPRHRKDWIEKIKSLPNRAWNQEKSYWSIPKTMNVLTAIQQLFGTDLKIPEGIEWNASKTEQFSTEQAFFDTIFKQVNTEDIAKNASNNFSIQIPTEVNIKEIQSNGYVQKVVFGNKIVLSAINEKWIAAFVPGDKKGWVEVVKNISGRRWNVESRCWCLPYVKQTIQLLDKYIGKQYLNYIFEICSDIPIEWINPKPIIKKEEKQQQLNEMQQKAITALEEKLMLEGKGNKTIKSYKYQFKFFLLFYRNEKPSAISSEQITKYVISRKYHDGFSDSSIDQLISALNAFYVRLLKQEDKTAQLQRPSKKKKYPNVLSEEEIERLLKSCVNLKHKCLLILIYSAGLRKGEVLNLKVNNLNFSRKSILVVKGKGGNDRYVMFSETAMRYLKEYLQMYRPVHWLFEGQTGGRYSPTSLQIIFDKARKKSGVNPNITIHGLRHSFATHLVEKSVPLHVVQDMLGHASIKTTEIYLHISNKYRKELKSPLDSMDI